MTGPDKELRDQNEFDAEFAAISHAYRAAGREEPSRAIDDALRAAARRAVNSGPHSLEGAWFSRWKAPLAAAAVVVLTVSITIISVDERPELFPPAVQKVVTPKPVVPLQVQPVEKLPQGAVRSERQTAPALEKRHDQDAAPSARGNVSDALRHVPVQRARAPAEPVPFAADPEIKVEKGKLDSPAPIAPAAMPETATAKESADTARTQALPKAAAAPAAPAFGAGAQRFKSQLSPAAPEPQAVTPQAEETSNLLKQAEAPEQWLKRIAILKAEGKAREAAEQLAKFRARYPDYPIPPELKSGK